MKIIAVILALPLTSAASERVSCVAETNPGAMVADGLYECVLNPEQRSALMRQAEGGDSHAASALVDYYSYGPGRDAEKAIRWLRVYSATTGKPSLELGYFLAQSKNSLEQNEGRSILRDMAIAGDGAAAEMLGNSYLRTEDFVEARAWFEQSALLGNVDGMIKLADQYEKLGLEQGRLLARLWLEVALKILPESSFSAEEARNSIERLKNRKP